MKLLPTRMDINKAKADERKREVDEGLSLARKVDALRETKADEERKLLEYRAGMIAKVQAEIDAYISERDSLRRENENLIETRKELIKPLDEEWKEINLERENLAKEKQSFYLSKEQLRIEEENLQIEQKKLTKTSAQINDHLNEITQAKQSILDMEKFTRKEYELAQKERRIQKESYETEVGKVKELKTQYEVGIETNKKEESILKEIREELNNEKRILEDRIATFERSKQRK